MVKVRSRITESSQLLIKRIAATTAELVRDGATIVNLSQGVPNLPVFAAARDAMVALLEQQRLPYTDVAGERDVRDTVATFVNHMYAGCQHRFSAEHVVVTAGAVQAVFNSLALSIEHADEVVMSPLPAYGLYKHQVRVQEPSTMASRFARSQMPAVLAALRA
mgnify:FL=1